jgi:hypothetical protein
MIRIRRLSLAERAAAAEARELAAQKEFASQLTSARGLRQVFDLLTSSNVPLVGHNMLLDVLHVYHSFIGILPSSYIEFKRRLSSLFTAGIFDTKCKSSSTFLPLSQSIKTRTILTMLLW